MSKTLVLGAIAFIALGATAVYYNAKTSPQPSGHSSVIPDMSGIESGEEILEIKIPQTFSDQAIMGERAFNVVCAACHGVNAAGKKDLAPPLVHKIYEPSHHGDAAFLSAAKNGVKSHHWPFGDMPPVKGLTNSDVANIAIFIRELQRENGIN